MSGPDAFEAVSPRQEKRRPTINSLQLGDHVGYINLPPDGETWLGGTVWVEFEFYTKEGREFRIVSSGLIADETGQEITLTLRKENPIK